MHIELRYSESPTSSDWADVLADFDVFSGVSKRRLRRLVRDATFAEFAAGDTVVSNGASSNSLYVILGGAARAARRPAARELGIGDCFGEIAIDGARHAATVIATQQLHVMRLPAKSAVRLARRHRTLTLALLRNLSEQLERPKWTSESASVTLSGLASPHQKEAAAE